MTIMRLPVLASLCQVESGTRAIGIDIYLIAFVADIDPMSILPVRTPLIACGLNSPRSDEQGQMRTLGIT